MMKSIMPRIMVCIMIHIYVMTQQMIQIMSRKKELSEQLRDRKLEYIKNGICDSYVKYGIPSFEYVINDIQTKTENQLKRLTKLIERLKKEGEMYDERISYYKKYIKYGG